MVQKDVETLRSEATAKAAEADKLAKLAERFPDLKKKVGRWNKVAFYSRTVNAQASGVDIRHNCGCCSDSPVEAWPYLETPEGKVFSDPPMFWVGERDYDGGERADAEWDKGMRSAGIPEAIIARVGAFLGVSSDSGTEDKERT